ncbi:C-Myc-binding protein, partial [Lamprotornis superbus]
MAHYKAADSKREQFRQYLEKSGVLDMLTKAQRALRACPESCEPFGARTFGVLEVRLSEVRAERQGGSFPRTWCVGDLSSAKAHHLGASAPENPEIEALRLEVAEMKEKYEAVLEENIKLKNK